MKSILQTVKKRVGGTATTGAASSPSNGEGFTPGGSSGGAGHHNAGAGGGGGGGPGVGGGLAGAGGLGIDRAAMNAADGVPPGTGGGGGGAGAGAAGGGGMDEGAFLPHNVPLSISPTSGAAQLAAQAIADGTPRADVTLPRHTPQRRRSSLVKNQRMAALKDLPALRDTSAQRREPLFQQKLQLCSVIFNFDDPQADKKGKDLKRQTLLELVDYINTPAGQKIFTEALMPDIMACVTTNICRALPPQTEDFDPEEDDPVLEPSWPHLQVVYEFFLRFIVSTEVNAKTAKKFVDQRFCAQLVELFDSEDPRERDYLKTILHRIYGKFMSHRSFIRKTISNVFYRFVYETERHNGIAELLEILGSIINGFAIPLKREHLQFLERALLPLHKPKCVALYHQQLSYCIIQYVEKDPDTAVAVLQGLVRFWPWSCSAKQVLFLNELEEVLELLGGEQLLQVRDPLFRLIARCLGSHHFQVAERALFLWNNENLVNTGCLSRQHAAAILPLIYGPLYRNSADHWNATVESLAQNVLKMYMDYDLALYDHCSTEHARLEEERRARQAEADRKWAAVGQLAAARQRERALQQPAQQNQGPGEAKPDR